MSPRAHRCSYRELAEEQASELARLRTRGIEQDAKLAETEAKLAAAMAQLVAYERTIFGRSAERVPPVDRELRQQDKRAENPGASAGGDTPDEGSGGKGRAKKRGARRPNRSRNDAPDLKTETVEHPLSERAHTCPHCGAVAEPMGTGKFTTEWDYIPGSFVRRRHVQEVVSCRCGQYVARAEPAIRVFDRTQFGPGLIAYLCVAKCADSLPIYRVEKQFERLGIPIARSTLNSLIHRAASVLEVLYDALAALVVHDPHCQADETSVRLHNRPDKRGFIWTFLAGKQVIYVFSGDRSGQTPSRLLGSTTGSLVVDGYTGYNVVTDVDGRSRGGCWSHARRYFFKALAQAPEAREVLDLILELFRVERAALKAGIAGTAEHQQLREARSRPILDQIKTWVAKETPRHLPEGPMGAALRYITNQWGPLTVFLSDPKIPIHNNASESALRIVALLRKNALFFGNEDAAANFSILLSIVTTAERHGVNPLAYIEDVLMRVQTHPAKDIADLLPDRWRPSG